MTNTASWLLKSLLIGAGAGLAVLALSYGFLMIHQEVGLRPSVSFLPAVLTFAGATVAALIYLRVRNKR